MADTGSVSHNSRKNFGLQRYSPVFILTYFESIPEALRERADCTEKWIFPPTELPNPKLKQIIIYVTHG